MVLFQIKLNCFIVALFYNSLPIHVKVTPEIHQVYIMLIFVSIYCQVNYL